MKKRSANNRRSASRAKLFVAALCLGLGWGAASAISAIPADSTDAETWSVRFESFNLFSPNSLRGAEERPLCYLDATGRRVSLENATAPLLETEPAFLAESEELLADDSALDVQPLGAIFAETVSVVELDPVSFSETNEEDFAATTENGWLGVDEDAEERDRWANEIAVNPFPVPSFAESSLPGWRDDVSVASATIDELRALASEPGLGRSTLVSSTLRRRAALAPLASGGHSFAETSNVADANSNASVDASQPEPPRVATIAPARVGSFSDSGAYGTNGVATVRIQ